MAIFNEKYLVCVNCVQRRFYRSAFAYYT